MNSHYPTIKQGFGLFGLGIGCHLIAGLASYGISNDWQLFAGQLVANLLVLAVALRLKWGEVDFAFFKRPKIQSLGSSSFDVFQYCLHLLHGSHLRAGAYARLGRRNVCRNNEQKPGNISCYGHSCTYW